MSKLPFFLVISLLSANGFAEEPVRFPKGPASWRVKIVPSEMKKKDKAAPSRLAEVPSSTPLPTLVTVDQDGEMRVSKVRWSNGRTRSTWSIPKMRLFMTEDPNGKTVIISKSGLFQLPFSFKEFDWVSMKNRVESKPVEYDGVMCYHHKGETYSSDIVTNETVKTFEVEAWIDAQTGLPVALDNGLLLGKFEFAPMEGTLEMPPKFQTKLRYFKSMMGME